MDDLGPAIPHLGIPELIILAFLLVFLLAPLVLAFYAFRKLLRWLRQ
jgi:hypothetical protein